MSSLEFAGRAAGVGYALLSATSVQEEVKDAEPRATRHRGGVVGMSYDPKTCDAVHVLGRRREGAGLREEAVDGPEHRIPRRPLRRQRCSRKQRARQQARAAVLQDAERFGIGAIVALMLAASTLFIVDQRQVAVIYALGEIKEVITEPGLKVKLPPPFQNVVFLDKRIQTLDSPETRPIFTAEKKSLVIDWLVKWRIAEPRQFIRNNGTDIRNLESRLSPVVQAAFNEEITKRTVRGVLAAEVGAGPELGLDERAQPLVPGELVAGGALVRRHRRPHEREQEGAQQSSGGRGSGGGSAWSTRTSACCRTCRWPRTSWRCWRPRPAAAPRRRVRARCRARRRR